MITRRLILFSIFLIFSSTFIVSGLFAKRARQLVQEQVEKRGSILLQAVGKQAMDSIRQGDFGVGLAGVIRSLHHDPEVEMAMIVDPTGRILAHTEQDKVGKKLFLSLWDQEVMKSPKPMLRFDPENNRYLLGISILGPGSYVKDGQDVAFAAGTSALNIGSIYIGLSQARIAEEANKTFIFIGACAMGLVLIGSILSIIFTSKIVRPLKTLGEATKIIAEGNLTMQVPVTSADEVGQLAAQFNAMTTKLRQTTISKNQLESVVAQKTKALKEANESLLDANSHLKRLQELESRFVSMASHELRTPLTSIGGFVSLMQRYSDRLTKEQTSGYLNSIASEVGRLGRMINEILDLKRIEQGHIEVHPSVVDMKAMAYKVVEELKTRPNQPNYQVVFPEELKGFLDEDKVKQIYINLLSNSAKYTPPDKNVFIIGLLVGGSIVINVKDEGPGIPKDLWVKLFHPFARANDEVARKTVGSGLGLAITKSLIETMGGKIRAENLETGAQFTVVLPQGNINAK